MSVTGLSATSLPALFPALGGEKPVGPQTDGGAQFSSAVQKALESLDAQQKGGEREIAKAVTGESPDLHQTIVALQTVDMNFQFAVQVRNKLVGAFDEVMRMQV